jgi:predicted dehydrogenase
MAAQVTIKVGVVGVGHLGRHHARIYASLPGVELVGIVDHDEARARAIAAEHGCPVLASIDELAARADAVSVAVPTVHHREVAVRLLEQEVDVLVEKPISRTLDEADAINAAAEATNRIVMVGHTERFNPAVKALAGAVRQPRFFEVHRLAAFTARSTDIDVVLDLMIHDLDLLMALDGTEPVSVDAVGIHALTDRVDIANARVRFASGCVANVTASRISTESLRRIRVFERHTYIACDTGKQSVERYRLVPSEGQAPEIRRDMLEVADEEPLVNELAAFVDAVRTRERPAIDGRQGARVLRMAHEVLASIEANLK